MSQDEAALRPRRRLPVPLAAMAAIAVTIAAVGMWGVMRAAEGRTDDVARIDGLDDVLASVDGTDSILADNSKVAELLEQDVDYPTRNYLLVGSDSREGAAGAGDDAESIGDNGDVVGQRSDTLMVLRQEANGPASLLSIPRDLWVEIDGKGKSARINSAFNDGPETLAATVSTALGIPIHHYIEVDFFGFKDIIDQLGGVEVCLGNESRDTHVGLHIKAGCSILSGQEALAFARSRYFEEWDGDSWRADPTADKGRVVRQQMFMRAAVNGALLKMREAPFSSGDTIKVIVDSVKIDARLEPIKAAQALRQAVEDGLYTYVLPTYDDRVGDAAVLSLEEDADNVLAYFRGQGPLPPDEYLTGTTTDPVPPPTTPSDS